MEKKFITTHRYGTTEDWNHSLIIPEENEIVIEECEDLTRKFKIGDGLHLFNSLDYATMSKNEINSRVDFLNNRIEELISLKETDWEEGKQNLIAEIINIRDLEGDGSVSFDTAGEAVRNIHNRLKNVEKEVSDARNVHEGSFDTLQEAIVATSDKVDILDRKLQDKDIVDGLKYEDNMLYLTANGKQVGDLVGPIRGGSGSSDGGTSSSADLKILYITNSPLVVSVKDDIELKFSFSGIDSSGDTINQANATWKIDGQTIIHGTVVNGENSSKDTFDIKKYLKVGTSTVYLLVEDDTGNKTSKTWKVQRVDLRVESKFNDKITYPIGDVLFDYTPYGAVDKKVHFILDNEVLNPVELAASKSGIDLKYNLDSKSHGAHLLEVYMTATIGITEVESNHIKKDILWYDSENNTAPVIGSSLQEFTAKQYDTTSIEYTVYDPLTENPDVKIFVDEKEVSSLKLSKPTNIFSYTTSDTGKHIIKIKCRETEKIITANIQNLNIDVSPVTSGLVFDFKPIGKSNSDTDRLWSSGDIKMTVSDNFDWINGGYQMDKDTSGNNIPGTEHFCIKSGTRATINYKLFGDDAKVIGKNTKIIFKTTNVSKPDSTFISCVEAINNTNIGLKMNIHEAYIYGNTGTLELAYSEDDIIEFEFNISKNTEDIPMVMGYEDGVSSRPMVYDDTFNFKQQNDIKDIVIGSDDCDVHIYRFKTYNTSLSSVDILSNFIADARTSDEILDRYNRNQIYDENQQLTPEILAEKCPNLRVYMLSAPYFTNDKKEKISNTTIRQIYKNGDPILDNWTAYNAQHSGQGTSSNNYAAAGRNLDFIMNRPDSYFELGDGTKSSTITLTRESVPTNYLNAKVNIASSNNLTNAMLAKRYNQFNPYKRPFIREDESLIEYIKDTMEFHNCVIFIKETSLVLTDHREFADNEWHFYAIGNIGDSKKTDNTRLTDMDDKYECCVEIMDVELPLSDFPKDTMYNAMGYNEVEDSETGENIREYIWAKDENLGILYEKIDDEYVLTTDTTVNLNKTYYIDILENDDFSEDFTYGWRYLYEGDDELENQEVFDYCKRKWIEFYRFLTTSSDEEFKRDLGKYFVVDSALYYYLFTTRYCMVDNRAKNTFWHYSKTRDTDDSGNPIRKWDLCWDYDNDTSLGLNNYGKQVYRYGLEDTDKDSAGTEVFRESDSTFFCRIRDCFKNELEEMFNTLEAKNAWNGESFIAECDQWQEEFPEELWRVDIERKYIRSFNKSFINGKGDEQFLRNMSNGKMKYHRRQWERNQEKYIASKYKTPKASEDKSVLRCTVPEGDIAVAPNYKLKLTPYLYMYLNVKYGTNSPIQVKAEPNKEFEIPFTGEKTDIIEIYSSGSIQDFGDLSVCYPQTADIGNAVRIKRLKLGNSTSGYENLNFTTLTTGANPLLEDLNLENISGLEGSLNLSKLTNLSKVNALGTKLNGIVLASGGKISELKLPETLNTLLLQNLRYLSNDNLFIESYDNISDLVVEGCPLIDSLSLLDQCVNVNRLRLLDVHLKNITFDEFMAKISHLKGLTADGKETKDAWLTGSLELIDEYITGTQYHELKTRYPELNIIYKKLRCRVDFSVDSEIIHTEFIYDENDCADPAGKIFDTPTKDQTDQYTFTFSGWSIVNDGITVSPSPLLNINNDITLYPTFDREIRMYPVEFWTGEDNLKVIVQAEWGGTARYPKENYGNVDPERPGFEGQKDVYRFDRWEPSNQNITGPTKCYAQFILDLSDEDFYMPKPDSDIICRKNDSDKNLSILRYDNLVETALKIPSVYSYDNGEKYYVTEITGSDSEYPGGFSTRISDNEEIIFVELANILERDTGEENRELIINKNAFANAKNLSFVYIPSHTSEIRDSAFANCKKLERIDYNAEAASVRLLDSITSYPFAGLSGDNNESVINIGPKVKSIPRTLFQQVTSPSGNNSNIAELNFDENSICETIGAYAFSNVNFKNINFNNIKTLKSIDTRAFEHNTNIEELNLPENLEALGSDAFSDWKNLKKVYIPNSLTSLGASTPFARCNNLEYVEVQSGNSAYFTPLANDCIIKKSGSGGYSLIQGTTKLLEINKAGDEESFVASIAPYSFAGLNIPSMKINSGVSVIGQYAFSQCKNLESISIPASVNTLEMMIFYNCENLKNIVFEPTNNKRTLNGMIFTECDSLTEIEIPFTNISTNVFYNCPALKTVRFNWNGNIEDNPYPMGYSGDIYNSDRFKLFSGPSLAESCQAIEDIYVNWESGAVPGEFRSGDKNTGYIDDGKTFFAWGAPIEKVKVHFSNNKYRDKDGLHDEV